MNANGNTASFRHLPMAPKLVPTDLPTLQSAGRVLADQFAKDAQTIPDLGDMLTIPGGQSSASYSVFSDDPRVPFQKRKLITIPESLWEHYKATEVVSHMGIIPELERVWVSIDSKLFLWDYTEGQELSSYTDQPDVIVHVALVKAKPGVFIDDINYVLVICTPVTVLLIGLSVTDVPGPSNRTRKQIDLYDTGMSIACGVEMTDIIGMNDGRIFMVGSQDGHLYELHYQEKEGWFGKRVQLIDHSISGVKNLFPLFSTPSSEDRIVSVLADAPRSVFYTLTANSIVSVYYPQHDKSIHLLQTIHNLYKLAQEKAPGSPALTPQSFRVISLHVIEQNESRLGIQLMAITMNGVRLYFAPSSTPYSYHSSSGTEPRGHRSLQLIHVRLPPPNLLHPDEQSNPFPQPANYASRQNQHPPPASRPFIVSSLERSMYSAGVTVAAQAGDTDGMDFLLCMSPDLTRIGPFSSASVPQPQYVHNIYGSGSTPQRTPLTERAILLSIPGRTWAMAVVPRAQAAVGTTVLPPDTPTPVVTNELAYQFLEPPKQFMILTNVGLTILAKRRAMDWLKEVIEEFLTKNNMQNIIDFRDSFGRDQTCAMLLALACGNTFIDQSDPSPISGVSTLSPEVAKVAKQAFYDCGERPVWTERLAYGTNVGDGTGTALFSGRREGFALYFARLVRPVWKSKLTKLGSLGLHETNISEDLLFMVQKNLFALKDFLDKNPHLFHSGTADYTGARAAPASDQEAWKAEQNSVAQLQTLLARTIEGASFFLLLNDHRIGELIAQTDVETQKLITSLTFEELITGQNGVAASRALVNVVIDQQIGQQIAVDTISDVLQARCGSFCSTDDVMLYKAKENTRKAVESRNPAERQIFLSESLRLFIKGARIIDFEKLREIIGDYQQLQYVKGAVELPLHCAEASDSDHLGQEYWLGAPQISSAPVATSTSASAVASADVDPRKEHWERRAWCYDLVLDSLESFEGKTGKDSEEVERIRAHAYELAFASPDEMFHSCLYEWLIGRGLADELLEMRPAYLEAYLQRDPPTVDKYQLLWQFYVKDGQPLRAAQVLNALAESIDFPLTLSQRLEYLTLAVGNAKSHPVSISGQHESAIAFLTELEEKLDVAQVQLEIYSMLLPRVQESEDEGFKQKVGLLERGLYNITELFQVYADPYDLSVAKLLIFHVSQHRDEKLLCGIWDRLFEEDTQGVAPAEAADKLQSDIVPLGQRFHPSDCAFPFRHIALLLVRFQLANAAAISSGWVPRILVQCGVPYAEAWDVLHQMYDSQIPPFTTQEAVHTLSTAICILMQDWLEAAKRSSSEYFPVNRIDSAVDMYLRELSKDNAWKGTREGYESIRRELRRNW